MEAMNDDLVGADGNSFLHATSSICIKDKDYAFVVTIRPEGNVVELIPQDMRDPDGNSMALTSLSCNAVYEAVNKKLKNSHVTPISHSLSDASRHITDDKKLKDTLAFERQFGRLFRLYLNPTPQALANHRPRSNVPDAGSEKHGQLDSRIERGATKRLKKSPKTDTNDDEEEPANMKANASINKYFTNGNCPSTEGLEDNDDAAEIDCDTNAETMSFAQKSTLFQQSL